MRLLISLCILTIGLSASSIYEVDLKKEIVKLFNGLPIHQGIEKVVLVSEDKFKYSEEEYMMGVIKKWETTFQQYNYKKTATTKVELELTNEIGMTSEEEYSVRMTLHYDNLKDAKAAYELLKAPFEKNGEKVDNKPIGDMQLIHIYLTKENKFPKLTFILPNAKLKGDYQVIVNFDTMLE